MTRFAVLRAAPVATTCRRAVDGMFATHRHLLCPEGDLFLVFLPVSGSPPLPQGPVLTLPAGVVGVLDAGRVLCMTGG